MSPLEGWDNFYVILGSAAAALLGLTFVVIALISERRANPAGMSGYITPTVVHFATVLGLSCFLSMPHQNVVALSAGLGTTAAGLLIYTAGITVHMRRFAKNYTPVLEDWIWHVTLPAAVYCALLAMALLLWREPRESMYGIASALLLLLFIGIHNSWDVAVSLTVQTRKAEEKAAEKPGEGTAR
jgi:predicted membrane channel-forming protein YqfA (hemolysin III family)